MQFLRIIGLCVIAAVMYGIVHDQFTAHICVEYFSVFHPPIFGTASPTLLAFGWGVVATWWMGAFLGVLLALSARVGSKRKVDAHELVRPIMTLLCTMGILATAAGITGYVLGGRGAVVPPPWISAALPRTRHAQFMADWWAHNVSYLSGFLGGLTVCVITIRKRLVALVA